MKKLRITFNSPVILSFVFLAFLATLAGQITGGVSTRLLFMTYHSSLLNPLTYLRFFTHVLGHAGWVHFLGNASYILLLGPLLEEKYGSKEIVEIIFITAFATPSIIGANESFIKHTFILSDILKCSPIKTIVK